MTTDPSPEDAMAPTTKPETIRWTLFDTPIDPLLAAVSPRGLCALEFDGAKGAKTVAQRLARHWPTALIERVAPEHASLAPVRSWLQRYFDGAREIIERRAHVNVGLSYVIMDRRHVAEIPAYAAQHGVRSFKFYPGNAGATPWHGYIGMPAFVDDSGIFAGFAMVGRMGGLAMVHAENQHVARVLGPAPSARRSTSSRHHAASSANSGSAYISIHAV